MQYDLQNIFSGNGRNAILEFYDNEAKNCFDLKNQPISDETFGNKTVFCFLFVPFYPLDTIILRRFKDWVELYPHIDFYFKSCTDELHIGEVLNNNAYNKAPVYLCYKNGTKVFEQIGGDMIAVQIQELLA